MGEAPKLPPCPKCNGSSEVFADIYRCKSCGGFHDGKPEDGGDYSDRDPSARLQREERRNNARRR